MDYPEPAAGDAGAAETRTAESGAAEPPVADPGAAEPESVAAGHLPQPWPVLELQHLAKRYGRVQALRDLSLRVHEGEVYGFLGRNGAGKSTAIRIIMGITQASSGEARLFGGDRQVGLIELRRRIGYVAQEQCFYGWMTPTQLGRFVGGFYPTWDEAEYRRLLAQLELPPTRKVRTFSGGMKVKLALALALAHRPELLVLDEPTAGLDPVARREFLEMVRSQAAMSRRTTFFSTHLVDEVELAAHRVCIVDAGRTLYEGSVNGLSARVRSLRHPLTDAETLPPLPAPLTSGEVACRIVRDEVREGHRLVVVATSDPLRLEAVLADAPGWSSATLPLEEAFIELVRRPLA